MRQRSLAIDDMSCVRCAGRVEGRLPNVGGVCTAPINLAEKVASIDYDDRQTGRVERINVVRREGFTPGAARLRMTVKRTSCASCIMQVEKALSRTPGVVSAAVDPKAAEVDIEYPPTVDMTSMAEAVTNSGYRLAAATRTTEEGMGLRDWMLMGSNARHRVGDLLSVVTVPTRTSQAGLSLIAERGIHDGLVRW